MHYEFRPQGVCSQKIELDLIDGVIRNAHFEKGCNGNLKAICALIDGQTPEWVIARVKGIHCGPRNTSCSDQLATMLELIMEQQ